MLEVTFSRRSEEYPFSEMTSVDSRYCQLEGHVCGEKIIGVGAFLWGFGHAASEIWECFWYYYSC